MTKIKLNDKEEKQPMKRGKARSAREANKEGNKTERTLEGKELKN
jgi:hypothetical protein